MQRYVFSIIYAVSWQFYPVDTPSIIVGCIFIWGWTLIYEHCTHTHAHTGAKCNMHMHNSFQWCNKLKRTHFVRFAFLSMCLNWVFFHFVSLYKPLWLYSLVLAPLLNGFPTFFSYHNHKYINVVSSALKEKR